MDVFKAGNSHKALSAAQRRAAYLARFRTQQADLTLSVRRLRSSKPEYSPAQLERIVASGVAEMDALAAQSSAQFERLTQTRLHAYRAHRAFQDTHGLARPALMPDVLSTFLVLMVCALAEAAFTAVLMITGGKMTILEGFGYGATVSSINLSVGTLAGFLPLRYAGYKRSSPDPQPRDAVIRCVAWASFALALGVLAVLHFAAARVRITGAASGIFDFSQHTFAATFADYYALGVMAIGAVGAVMAVTKGFSGFADPVPGYLESRKAAGERIEADGRDSFAEASDTLSLVFLARSEEAQALLEDAQERIASHEAEREALARARAHHNVLIETACDDLALVAADEAARQSFIAGEERAADALRLDDLRTLKLPDPPEDSADPSPVSLNESDAFTRLQAAHDQAASTIRSAFAAFLTDLTRFDFSPREEETPHEHALTNPPRFAHTRANGHARPLAPE